MAAALLASLSIALAASLGPVQVQLEDRDIRLHDLAKHDEGGVRGESNPVIARLPRGASQIELDEETARRLIQNQIPAARPALTFAGTIVLRAPQSEPANLVAGRDCYAASVAIEQGAFITFANAETAACDASEKDTALRYDRDAKAPYAAEQLAAGTYLGAVRPAPGDIVAKHANVTLITGAGAVSIARDVTTLQPGREGENVFIRTEDGDVFAVPFSNIDEDETR